MTHARTAPAFTLIELIVVMAIIVTLSVIGFISYNSYVMDSRNAVREAQLNDIAKVIDQFIFVNGRAPQCASGNICYFVDEASKVTTKMTGTTDNGPGFTNAGGSGILTTDWAKFSFKKSPEDPRGVYFAYVYNGQKYVILATKELSNGYATILRASESIEQSTTDLANNANGNDTNVLKNVMNLSVGTYPNGFQGHTVTAGVVGPNYPAGPLAIKYNNFLSVASPSDVGSVTFVGAIPYFW